MIITITRLESVLIGVHRQGGLYTQHETGFQSQSQSNNLALVYETPDQHPLFSKELLSTSKRIVFLPFRWPNYTTTSGRLELLTLTLVFL